MRAIFLVISFFIILIGIQLYSEAKELQEVSSEMTNSIFEPAHNVMDSFVIGQNYTYDHEDHMNHALSNIGFFTIKAVDFERSLVAGLTCIILGITSIIYLTRKNLSDFIKSFVNYNF